MQETEHWRIKVKHHIIGVYLYVYVSRSMVAFPIYRKIIDILKY